MVGEIPYKTYFSGKKITILGLGLLGRGVNVAKFLAELGVELLITDLKSKEELASSCKQLKKFEDRGQIQYVFGEHRLQDFKDCDMVIKAAGVPLDSPYVAEAKKNGTPVEMDASLFAKFSKATIVGVTGTRGKTTVTHLIHHILETAKKNVFLGGNIRGLATLPLLKKVREGDIVVLELDSWQLQGFGEAKISPQISVFTNFFPDHLNYYQGKMDRYFRDKANIFRFQTKKEILIAGEQALKEIKARFKGILKNSVVVARKGLVPKTWKIKIPGQHNLVNIACAVLTCRALGVSEKDIKRGVETFAGVPGRFELVRIVGGVYYVNDTTATSPAGLFAALDVFSEKKTKHIVLLAGGADKQLDYGPMAKRINSTVKALILFKGGGTDKIVASLSKNKKYPFFVVGSMAEAIALAKRHAEKGDTVLLSPGTASFGVFKNEFDRGDQFTALVKKLA